MANIKKQWFDVPDSLTKGERGKEYCNVEARFSDHPVINVEESRAARRNVYEYSIVLHTRVKRNAFDAQAQPNVSAHALRFDKGRAMGGEDFEKAKLAIMRCWDAWEHYQKFRQAPVTVAEQMALEQIERAPITSIGTIKVKVGGKLVDALPESADDEDEDEEDDQVAAVIVQKPVSKSRKPGKASNAAK